MAAAAERGRKTTHHYPSGATTQEAAYIEEYRPY
jgi:hypothetical protein